MSGTLNWASSSSIPAGTYDALYVGPSATSGTSLAVSLAGNVTVTTSQSCTGGAVTGYGFVIDNTWSSGGTTSLTTAGFTVSATGSSGIALTVNGASLIASTSTVTTAGVLVNNAAAYITSSAAGLWTVTGSWTNASTSGSWNFQALIVFKATSSKTLSFSSSLTAEFSGCYPQAGDYLAFAVAFDTGASGLTYTMAGGPLTVSGAILVADTSDKTGLTHVILNAATNNVSLTSTDGVGCNGGLFPFWGGGFIAGSAGPHLVQVNPTSNGYLKLGSGTWVITRGWVTETMNKTDWDAGTGTVEFLWASSFGCSSYLVFGGEALGINEIKNVTFDTSNAAGVSYCMAGHTFQGAIGACNGNLYASGTVTIQNTAGGATGSVTLDTSASSFSINAGSLTVGTLGQLNDRASTVTLTGDLTSISGGIAGASGTFLFSDSVGQVLSLATKHTVNVAGSDIGTLSVSGTTTLLFSSSFETEKLVDNATVLFAFLVTGSSVTWTYNSTVPIAGSFYLYLESTDGTNLCTGKQWFFTPNGLVGVSGVSACDSAVTIYGVQAPAGNVNGGNNLNWSFAPPSGQAPIFNPIVCDAQPAFFFTTLVSCHLAFGGMENSPYYWRVNGDPQGNAPTLTYYYSDLRARVEDLTVAVSYVMPKGETFDLFSRDVPVDPSMGAYLGWIAVALILFGSIAAFGRRELPSVHNPSYRETAMKTAFYPDGSRHPDWVSYRQKPPRYTKYRSKHRNGVWVVYGIRKNGNVDVQTVREPVTQAPKAALLRAMDNVPVARREDVRHFLERRGLL